MNAAARPSVRRRRARRRRLFLALLVALGTLALGAGVGTPDDERPPPLLAFRA